MTFVFFMFLAALDFGPPFWWGYSGAPVWTSFIWSATMAVGVVWGGWRAPKGGVVGSLAFGTCIAAAWCVPSYFLGRWLLGTTMIWPWLGAIVLLAGVIYFLFLVFFTPKTGWKRKWAKPKKVGDAMSETRSYEFTHEEVVEICQTLKLHTDALDHREGSRADVAEWARQAGSLWRLIDKLMLAWK